MRNAMARKRIAIETGSGNVFADLGYADARERRLKVELAMEVNRLLGERGLTQARAAKLLGMLQPHVSDLSRYRLDRFSVERLMRFLTQLGRDVEIRISARPARGARPSVRLLHAR
jgi:predicted XRE-type DNA-binding protein